MEFDEFKNLEELKPRNLVEGKYYYLTIAAQSIKVEKALFKEKKKRKINTEYFFEINGRIILDNVKNGLFDVSNGGYWHVYRINPKYSYITENEFKTFFKK